MAKKIIQSKRPVKKPVVSRKVVARKPAAKRVVKTATQKCEPQQFAVRRETKRTAAPSKILTA